MPARPTEPLRERLCVTRCRLTCAQQRIRELEALLTLHQVAVPAWLTQVPPITHNCFSPWIPDAQDGLPPHTYPAWRAVETARRAQQQGDADHADG